jgi:signal transduction histidine kinase
MGKRAPIRHRLITILLSGAIVSALLVGALFRLLNVSLQHRIDRTRDGVLEAVSELTTGARSLSDPAPGGVIGMRAGVVRDLAADPVLHGLPAAWAPMVEDALHRATAEPAWSSAELSTGTLVFASALGADGQRVWAGMEVRPLAQLEAWKVTIWLLALATSLLVATTVHAVVVTQRGASELGAALEALSRDLDAPIPRSSLRELSDVADGVARLVQRLAQARREEERLAQELHDNERLAALGRVAAGVAHEVRNPLASIKLRLDLAASLERLPPAVEQAIAHATSEIERLDRLVADLLVVAGRSTGPRVTLSLGQLARTRTEALGPWAGERHVSIEVSGDADVQAHADSLGRALDNLLRNAVEASPSGARVRVEIADLDERATLAVSDVGSGVPELRQSELFEPFFTTKPNGTGLGLPLARSIARAHGGDVHYLRAGEETRFELELPLAVEGGASPQRLRPRGATTVEARG